MTDDKDFKHLVRAEARRSGRRYTDVRAELRAPDGGGGRGGTAPRSMLAEEVAGRFAEIVAAIETWRYGPREQAWLVGLALLVPGNVLVRGAPGNGMTALGQGVAAAIGGRLVSIDGRAGFGPHHPDTWRPGDVINIAHLDGMEPADQVAMIEHSREPAIVLAKRHPIADRMPHLPDDEIRERFLFGVDFDAGDLDLQLRILNEAEDKAAKPRKEAVVSSDELVAMRDVVAVTAVPDAVRRHIVSVVDATRSDPEILVGASIVATLMLSRAAAACAAVDGRDEATIEDVERLIHAVLDHRLVRRE